VPIVNNAYQFLLDVNQTGANPLLSLDALRIFTRSTALTSASTLTSLTDALGIQQRYNLDAGDLTNSITLNFALNSGSGSGDMYAYIPTAFFPGALPGDFVYVYSRFGDSFPANDGFEEWAVRTPVNPPGVPDSGSTVMLLGAALAAIALIRRLTSPADVVRSARASAQ